MKCLQRIRFDYSIDTLFAYVQTSQSSEVRRVQDFLRAYDEIMCHRIFSVSVVARATDRFEPRWNVPLGVERGFWVVCRITRSHKTSPEHNTAIKKEWSKYLSNAISMDTAESFRRNNIPKAGPPVTRDMRYTKGAKYYN